MSCIGADLKDRKPELKQTLMFRRETRRMSRVTCPSSPGRRGLWLNSVHPAFPGKDVPVRKKAPPSRKSKAIATHAASGVNGHGNHGTHGPQPNPQNSFFPFTPTPFWGREGGTQLPGRGCGGPCFPWIPWLIWGGAEGQRCPCNHLPRNSRKNPKSSPAENPVSVLGARRPTG